MRQERRKFLRHPIRVPIKLKIVDDNSFVKSQTADLSEEGMRFEWPDELSQGTLLDVTIPIGNRLFKITGQVVYSTRESTTGLFRTGVAFQEPMMAFRAKLAEEILRIQQFRQKVSRMLGHPISEEEAASKWIKKYAEKFAQIYQT